jgi:hypothetical protein
VSILYKYIGPGTEEEPVPIQLRTQTLSATDPGTLNDPFEVRPWFDQERHAYYARAHEQFYQRLGLGSSLTAEGTLAEVPVENVVGFGDTLNRRFREELGKRFRILCMSANRNNVLMWGHYTRSYQGAVIGIDVDDLTFPVGTQRKGFAIDYLRDRSQTRLPLAYYQFPPVEKHDLRGELVNDPNEEVITDGGLIIPFSTYHQQVEDAYLRAITTKAASWSYEEEIRFIYELPTHSDQLRSANGLSLVAIPSSAIREIIIGFNATIPMVEGIVSLFGRGAFGSAQLHYTTCHPHLFEVQAHETDSDYLLDYFKVILPAKD